MRGYIAGSGRLLRRLALLVLVLCALSPLAASAHRGDATGPGDEVITSEPPQKADTRQAGSPVEVAQAPCRGGPGHGCGCHGSWCARTGNPAAVDVAPHVPALRPADSVALPLFHAVPLLPAPLTHPPRAPPLSS